MNSFSFRGFTAALLSVILWIVQFCIFLVEEYALLPLRNRIVEADCKIAHAINLSLSGQGDDNGLLEVARHRDTLIADEEFIGVLLTPAEFVEDLMYGLLLRQQPHP